MFGLGVWELLIVLAIVLLIFGPKRLKSLGADLGSAIKGFRTAVKEDETPRADDDPRVIEGRVEKPADRNDAHEKRQDSNV
jgi:sec-independent protein translocase protein TatA